MVGKADARCYWDTQFSIGWYGPDLYAGRACYTEDGLQMISFTPMIPIG